MRPAYSMPLLLLCFFQAQTAHAEELANLRLPELAVITGMETEWVARTMVYNGHPMSIRTFKYHLNARDVIRHYASLWKVKGHGQQKSINIGGEHSIGFSNNGFTFSVKVRDVAGGSEGALVVTRDRQFRQGPVEFPLFPNTRLITRIHSFDVGVRAETFTLSSQSPVSVVKQWYRSTLTRKGWAKQPGYEAGGKGMLAFQKGKALCQLTFIDQMPGASNKSMVMIHWIKG